MRTKVRHSRMFLTGIQANSGADRYPAFCSKNWIVAFAAMTERMTRKGRTFVRPWSFDALQEFTQDVSRVNASLKNHRWPDGSETACCCRRDCRLRARATLWVPRLRHKSVLLALLARSPCRRGRPGAGNEFSTPVLQACSGCAARPAFACRRPSRYARCARTRKDLRDD